MDITYVPIHGGFIYLCAVIDWYSRAVLAWELSNTLDAGFCVRAVQRAIPVWHGVPEIFNTDQGCQFTSSEFTQPLLALGVKLSMDGKGRCLDNVFVERLWRTVKYDEIYLKSYQSQIEAQTNLEGLLPLLQRPAPAQRLRQRQPNDPDASLPPRSIHRDQRLNREPYHPNSSGERGRSFAPPPAPPPSI
jgi:putative transposase